MSQYNDFAIKLVEKLGKDNVKIDEPMKKHTSFKVGGPADILVTPESYDQLKEVISLSRINKIPCLVIGNGSNILVKDGGIRGIVLKISKLNGIKVDNDKMIVQSGAILSKVSKVAAEHEFTGFEFASGIPGSVGGAITMNAGAYNGEISQVIESAIVLDKDMNILTLSKEDLELGYRMSSIIKNGYTVLEAVFKFEKGNKDNIYARIEDLGNKRREKQPLEYPSAGSTFKRPEGHFAAKLIEDSGLKGVNVGDAEVSRKHSGFIINKGSATASDIIDLINLVQKTVKDKFDVNLHTEVIIIGEDK